MTWNAFASSTLAVEGARPIPDREWKRRRDRDRQAEEARAEKVSLELVRKSDGGGACVCGSPAPAHPKRPDGRRGARSADIGDPLLPCPEYFERGQ